MGKKRMKPQPESSESMDLDYAIIETRNVVAQWTTMTGYKSFASE
jgi:hypothetical protein